MAYRGASHQARLKSQTSAADNDKASTTTPIILDPNPRNYSPSSPFNYWSEPHCYSCCFQLTLASADCQLQMDFWFYRSENFGGEQPYPSSLGQMAHAELHGQLKPLADSECLQSIKATHAKEIEGLNSKNVKLEAALETERKNADDMAEEWLATLEGKRFQTDIREEDYHAGYQDAQKKIYETLTSEDPAFSPTKKGLPAWVLDFTPRADVLATSQIPRGKDAERVTSMDTDGAEIPMDSAYLNSDANLDSLARMDRTLVPMLTEVGQGDAVILEEEDQSAALHLNCRQSGSSEPTLPTGPKEGEEVVVP
nr:flocculation protein FLO11-like [Ipomoea batatas]